MDSEADGDRNRRIRRRQLVELNRDVIIEILARLPVKSLLRFKSVSKHWYSLILSPDLIAAHSERSHHHRMKSKVSLTRCVWTRNVTENVFHFDAVPEKLSFRDQILFVHIVNCYNGILCLSLVNRENPKRPQRYALWNPAGRQLKELKKAPMKVPAFSDKSGWYGSGFCFHPVTNSFKVAQIKLTASSEGETTRAQVNVYSTAANSWTKKIIDVPYRICGCDMSPTRGVSCAKKYLYWLITTENKEDMYILSYDMFDEVFKRIEMPFRRLPWPTVWITDFKGSPTLFVHREVVPAGTDVSYEWGDAWVLNDCGGGANQSWSKLLTSGAGVVINNHHHHHMVPLTELLKMRSNEFLYSESLALLD